MKRALFFLPVLFFSCIQHASAFSAPSWSSAYILKGSVGKSKVTMELLITGDEVSGRYFYNKTCLDIFFEGETEKGAFSFHTGSAYESEEERERFYLKQLGDHFTGTWKYKGKTLNVDLAEIPLSEITNPFSENRQIEPWNLALDPYNAVRNSLITFERLDSFTVVNGVTFQWFKESHWESYVMRAVKGLPVKSIRYINDICEAEQVNAFCQRYYCDNESNYDTGIGAIYADSNFFSFQTWSYYACEGARPDNELADFNYDLNNRKQLKNEDLIQFPGFAAHEADGYEAYSEYQTTVFSQKIHDYFKATFKEIYSVENVGEDDVRCDYNDPGIWAFCDLLITKEGLLAEPYFPTSLKYCNNPEWSVIPYEVFSDYLRPEYKKQLLQIH